MDREEHAEHDTQQQQRSVNLWGIGGDGDSKHETFKLSDTGFHLDGLAKLWSMSDYAYSTLIDMMRALERREISSVELFDQAVSRVEQRNAAINAVVTMDADRARARARWIDEERAAGRRVGVLAGIPMTIKDSLMLQGVRTTSGAPELSNYVADRNADCVQRLLGAGAVIFAKTNLPIYAGDVQSFNEIFGTTNNPWDVSRSCGGSSGGSAAAVAAGFTPLEVGSDIGGSIRNPAGMCGVVGHKPSYGLVSARGQIPGPPGTLTQADIAVVGPLARSVADCELALDLMAGADEWHAPAWSISVPPARPGVPRVAVWADDPACPVDPEIRIAIESVAEQLASLGCQVDETARPAGFDFAKADAVFSQLLGSALSGGYSLSEVESMAERVARGERVEGELGVEGATLRHRAWLSANERRLQMRARWREFFTRYDVVLAPISPTVAIPHDHSFPMSQRWIDVAGTARPYTDQMRWMGLFGVSYLPATAVPIATHSNGLPIGLQVVGPFAEDRTALKVAALVERVSGGFKVPPGWA
jgi:amidase